jgi:integrase
MGLKDFAEYLAGKGLSESTLRVYLNYYRRFDDELEGKDLTQSFVNHFLLTHTSNATRSFLNNLFEFLEIDHLKVPKLTGRKARKKRKAISPQEIKVLRKWIYHNKHIRYLLCFDLSYFCALRRNEVMQIKVEDFDIKQWAIDPKKKCKLLIHGKGKIDRYVPVPPKIMHRIIDYIEEEDKGLEDRLFSFHYTAWHEAFKDAVKETMDHNFTLHDLRRSRATQWLKEGIDLSRVKNRLGHASVQTTQLYINLDEEKEFDAWAKEN